MWFEKDETERHLTPFDGALGARLSTAVPVEAVGPIDGRGAGRERDAALGHAGRGGCIGSRLGTVTLYCAREMH